MKKNSLEGKKARGSTMLLFVFMVPVFLALASLTIDLGHIYVVRNELQNAADAIALGGAAYLYPSTAGSPNWSLAQTKALAAAPNNKVDGVAIATADVTTGYWSLNGTTNTALKATSITPTNVDVPAVMVKVSKESGKNGGPVALFFGSILGLSTVDVRASAVAIVGAPSAVKANSLFPIAMASSLYNAFWDSTTNQPKIDPSTGQPYVFKISEGPQGGWSTFNTQINDTNSIINLMTSGNPIPLAIGNNVWMSTGVKTAVYDAVPTNKDVLVAITADTAPGTYQPIVAFGALHIDFAVGGSQKYIQVRFINNFKFSQGEPGGGPNYGAYTPPRLAK